MLRIQCDLLTTQGIIMLLSTNSRLRAESLGPVPNQEATPSSYSEALTRSQILLPIARPLPVDPRSLKGS